VFNIRVATTSARRGAGFIGFVARSITHEFRSFTLSNILTSPNEL